MASLRIISLACFLCCLLAANLYAQLPYEKRSYPLILERTRSIDTSIGSKKDLQLPMMRSLLLTKPHDYTFLTPDLSFLSGNFGLSCEPPSLTVCENFGTFTGRWEKLTGKPLFDTSIVYYSPLRVPDSRDIYNNKLYRTGATIFNMVVSAKYPYYPGRKSDL